MGFDPSIAMAPLTALHQISGPSEAAVQQPCSNNRQPRVKASDA